jgi:ATP-dependent Zn protease
MATAEGEAGIAPPVHGGSDVQRTLIESWRRLGRAATVVALLTSPSIFIWATAIQGWSWYWSLLATVVAVGAFRGAVELLFRRAMPWPSLFGNESARAREEDIVNRRRVSFWAHKLRLLVYFLVICAIVYVLAQWLSDDPPSFLGTPAWVISGAWGYMSQMGAYAITLPFLFLFNFLILMGPLLAMGIMQIRGFEPGDADWGVKLDDVRGQAEAKEEVRRVVTLWQSGEAFEEAGGKRERGLLFLGAPGTGKTMLAKAIATGFNSPIVTIPGSGFASTFIGIDAVLVRYLAHKARKLARRWGGQCIVFIDEIDAIGLRRQSLGGVQGRYQPVDGDRFDEGQFYGPMGAINPSGDLILETRAWRDRMFEIRADGPAVRTPAVVDHVNRFMVPPGMMGGGSLALNQLLVIMDGISNPPFKKRLLTNKVNLYMDALFVIPRRVRGRSLRVRPPKPSNEQIYFVGACNVPIEVLDPALTRPGRLGRHVWFRTPTKQDRLDIFNLYIDRVSHEPDLDSPQRRDEIARITNGYSPAMIEQVCSMALTIAHHDGRARFGWTDLVDALTTVEAGTAVGVEYVPDETRAVAIHEAGHAVAAHVYMKGAESTRLSIRARGGSLGHHQALEKEERFSSWRHEEMGRLTWTLGAMAAERVFYGENSRGVGGDVASATWRVSWMVGNAAMAPERLEFNGKFVLKRDEDEAREAIQKRFEEIGLQIMRRAGGGNPYAVDPVGAALSDPYKRAAAAQLLGKAYVDAHLLIEANRGAVEHIADVLVERKELHGDEVLELLDQSNLVVPEVDLTEERAWPKL